MLTENQSRTRRDDCYQIDLHRVEVAKTQGRLTRQTAARLYAEKSKDEYAETSVTKSIYAESKWPKNNPKVDLRRVDKPLTC